MKKNTIYLILLLCFGINILFSQNGRFRVMGTKTQIAYNSNAYSGEYLSFGKGSSSPFNGEWGIEYWNGGLNFWKPWPSANNGNHRLFIADWGCVGINCTPNQYNSNNPNQDRLHVNGKIISRGHFTWSDERTKCQITNLSPALNKIMSLRTVSYYDKANIKIGSLEEDTFQNEDQSKNFAPIGAEYCDTIRHFGLIAQEVKNIIPNLVSETKSGVLALNYVEIVPLLIKSTQEQQAIIDSQSIKIEQLRQEIQDLKGKTVYTDVDKTKLYQNDPNPFRGTTNFTYFIDENVSVSNAAIEIRSIMGVLQSTISLNDKSGLGKTSFDASNLAEGYYVYTLKVNGSVKDSKMMLIGDN